MVVIKAIPKKLLIHEVTHAWGAQKDRWGRTEAVNEQTLSRVRMEPSKRIIRDKNNAEIQLVATMFYDCRNSVPKSVIFAIDDSISFFGERYRIKEIEPLYDGKRLHHVELGLVKSG